MKCPQTTIEMSVDKNTVDKMSVNKMLVHKKLVNKMSGQNDNTQNACK